MKKDIFVIICLILAVLFTASCISYAAETSTGRTAKTFWKKVVNYPAKVTQDSVNTVADTGKGGAAVVAKEAQRVGEVTTGDVAKTKEMVTEPLTGTAETTVKTVESTAKIPVEAAKEEPKSATTAQQ